VLISFVALVVSVELLVDLGISVDLLVDLGMSVELLVDLGMPVDLLVDLGVSVDLLVDLGISVDLLVDLGMSVDLLVDLGISVDWLVGFEVVGLGSFSNRSYLVKICSGGKFPRFGSTSDIEDVGTPIHSDTPFHSESHPRVGKSTPRVPTATFDLLPVK